MRRALVLALVLLAALPAAAGAHAQVTETQPARGAQLDAVPEQVVFRFSEDVSEGIVRVYDASGQEIQDGDTFQPEGDQLAVPLPAGLPDGGLTATFRAISADSHPVSGGFSFVVGEGGGGPQAVDRLLQGTNSGPVTATALGAARALQYAAITLAAGTLLFLALCAPAAAREAIAPRVSGALAVAAVTGLVASVAGLLLHGAQAAGEPVWSFELSLGTQFAGRGCLPAVVGSCSSSFAAPAGRRCPPARCAPFPPQAATPASRGR